MTIEDSIGYYFKNKAYLEEALTHTSYANEHGVKSNEKLEYLGDSILEFVSSEFLYNNFVNLNEGELTKLRAMVVCEESLYQVAKKHNFYDYIKVGNSEKIHGNNYKEAILADAVETFFDGGLEKSKKFILDNLTDKIFEASKHIGEKDYKTVLQEELQKDGDVSIKYHIISESGPDHSKIFVSEVSLNGKVLASGEGRSKKMAEMEAARKALKNIIK